MVINLTDKKNQKRNQKIIHLSKIRYERNLDNIGNTPLVELKSFYSKERNIKIYAKSEFLNPSGSIKDRVTKEILKNGIISNKLKAGMEIIDAVGINMGTSYCVMSNLIDCSVTIFVLKEIAKEYKNEYEKVINLYKANVIEVDSHEGKNGSYEKIKQIISENPQKYFKKIMH